MMVPLDALRGEPRLPLHPKRMPSTAAPALDAGEAVVGGAAGDAAEEIAGEEDERGHRSTPAISSAIVPMRSRAMARAVACTASTLISALWGIGL